MSFILSLLVFIILGGAFIHRQKKLTRLKRITLKDKLMASTIKSPTDGNLYF
jgi:hypothetical protein